MTGSLLESMDGSVLASAEGFATQYIAGGGQVVQLQKILGHSDLRVTVRYVHALIGDLKVATQKFSPVAKLG